MFMYICRALPTRYNKEKLYYWPYAAAVLSSFYYLVVTLTDLIIFIGSSNESPGKLIKSKNSELAFIVLSSIGRPY